jgi:uncharacterized protein YuzE
VTEMKMRYDSEGDVLYVQFSDVQIDGSEEIRPGVILDYDEEGRVVGIEVLDAR